MISAEHGSALSMTAGCLVEGAPESGAAAKRRGVGAGETGPTVCEAKRGSGSANAMTWTPPWMARNEARMDAALAVPRQSTPPCQPSAIQLWTLTLTLTLTWP